MSTKFSGIELGPPIEVFALNKAFLDDTHAKKVNLTIGAYRNSEGKPWVLPVVRKVESALAQDETLNHEYLPVLGLDAFSQAAAKMLLGPESLAVAQNRAIAVQTLSGTGALRVAAEFLARILKCDTFYYSKPTWENHRLIFINSGFKHNREYRYWNQYKRCIDFDGMIEDLKKAPQGSVIILHACAHNPTGCDPTQEQWEKIADIVVAKNLFPLFDIAYQGFASGDLDHDAFAVRMFDKKGIEFMATQSFAKNFGLYNERVGNLTIVTNSLKEMPEMKSQLTLIVRGMYSNPPSHGARIVSAVLNDPALFKEWKDHIQAMSGRIKEMRSKLYDLLTKLGTPGTWEHIITQIGMFSYTGLSEKQAEYIMKTYHVYLLRSGRINICGLNDSNVDYVAQAIHDAVIKFAEVPN